MPVSSSHDPRAVLVRDKYFTLRPKPLERWLWQLSLPAAAERVFWLHWEEGMRAGDWCSQIPIREVAARCCLDTSTVTRAYQVLRGHGLLRRESDGRDPANPFQQATAVTEVLVPRELVAELSRCPNRPKRNVGSAALPASDTAQTAPESCEVQSAIETPEKPATHLKYRDYQRLLAKLSSKEKARYSRAWMDKTGRMDFDPGTSLNADEQQHVQWQLHLIAQPAAEAGAASQRVNTGASTVRSDASSSPASIAPRRLSTLAAARLHRKLSELVAPAEQGTRLREILWSIEEGALRRFDAPLAVNIALKKLREGQWTRPNRMPPNWMRRLASPETCSAA